VHWLTELQNRELLAKRAAAVGKHVVEKLTQHGVFFKSGRPNRSAMARALGLKAVQFEKLWQEMKVALAGED
jgi:hypothetical protein